MKKNFYHKGKTIMQLSDKERIKKDKELSKYANGIYAEKKDLLLKNAKCILASRSNDKGFYAEAFRTGDEIIIAIRGTEPSKLNDLWTDFQMVINEIPNQYIEAIEFYNEVLKYCQNNRLDKRNIVITGHSLGGSLAELLGYFTGSETVIFNPYGVQNLLNHQIFLRLDNSRFNENIRVYGNLNDAVFYVNISNQIGTIYVADTKPKETTLRLLTYHGIDVMGNLSDFRVFNRAIDMKYGTLTLKQYLKQTLKQKVLARKKE